MQSFKKGDHVSWNSHGGKKGTSAQTNNGVAVGTVQKRLTNDSEIKGHKVRASPGDPQYLVRSENGGIAAHKPSALKRR